MNQDEISNYSLLIFNRWGEVIFESTDVWIGWDGKHDGIEVPNDVFVWKIRYQANNETKELIGHVQMLR